MASITDSIETVRQFLATVPKAGGGFLTAYNVKTFFDQAAATPTVATPCAIVDLELENEDDNPGFSSLAFQGGGAQLEFTLRAHILFAPKMGTEDFTKIQPDVIALLDNFFATLKANPLMTMGGVPATHFPFGSTKFLPGQRTWGTAEYHELFTKFKVELNL